MAIRGLIGALAIAAALAGMPARAADIRVATLANGPYVLVAGEFEDGDGERFVRLTAALPKTTTVVFDSPGGNLLAGLKIGETIHARGYATLVADGSTCASACAIAWLGGTKRFLSSAARLGFHAASNGGGVSAPGNAIVGAYMARLGLSQDAVYALTEAGPDAIAWFDAGQARMLGISVEGYAGAPFASPALATRGGAGASPAWSSGGASRASSAKVDNDAGTPSSGGSYVSRPSSDGGGAYTSRPSSSGGTSTGVGGRSASGPCPPYVYGGHSGC